MLRFVSKSVPSLQYVAMDVASLRVFGPAHLVPAATEAAKVHDAKSIRADMGKGRGLGAAKLKILLC